MANLPPHFKENDVDQLLAKFGQVVSTRILRDTHGHSKGVGFARMESREKCEQIIQVDNTSILCSNAINIIFQEVVTNTLKDEVLLLMYAISPVSQTFAEPQTSLFNIISVKKITALNRFYNDNKRKQLNR